MTQATLTTELRRLPDGTPYHGTLGCLAHDPDEDKIQCHLCGDGCRYLTQSHLSRHGWTHDAYRDAFQLRKSDKMCAPGVRSTMRRRPLERDAAVTLKEQQASREPTPHGPPPSWRSLTQRPELVRELHPTHNGNVEPRAIAVRSTRKLWWLCVNCGNEWRAAPAQRTYGNGCPACAAQRRAENNRIRNTARGREIRRAKTLAIVRPDLYAQLHPTRNGNLDLDTIFEGSLERVWW